MRDTSAVQQKVGRAVIAVCIFFVFQVQTAGAAEESITYHSAFKFGGGIVSAFLIHEAAHELVAAATGTKISWNAGDVNQPLIFKEGCSSETAGLALNSSGLISQAVAAEIILRSDKIDKNDSFVRGMMLWDIINPITYVIDYWFLRRTNKAAGKGYQGDLQGVEKYSSRDTANVFSATLLALSAFQGYRYAKTQSWAPDWLKGKESDKIGLAPLPSGGAVLSYTLEF